MEHVMHWLRLFLRWGCGLSFVILMIAVTVQVVSRTFIGGSPVWTEELTRFALLYLAGFGTGIALITGDLVNVDLVSESLPGRWPWLMRLISAAMVLIFCLFSVGPALRFTQIGAMQTSPAMGLRMSWVHGSVLLLLVMLGIAAALRVWGMMSGKTDGRPENLLGEVE